MIGAEVVAEQLAELGVRRMYGVSGNQVLELIDAADRLEIPLVHMRHETAALFAAAGAAATTGELAVALTSAGPGFLAALQGIAAASAMEVPVLVLSGASPSTQKGQGAFQEVDQTRIAGALCRATFEPTNVADLRATIQQAARLAQAGVPGPVHVALPVDVLNAAVSDNALSSYTYHHPSMSADTRVALLQIAEKLRLAKRPALVVRPAATRGAAAVALEQLAWTLGVAPIVADAPRGLVDPRYADLAANLADADVTLLLGPLDFLTRGHVGQQGELLVIDAPGEPNLPDGTLRAQYPPSEALAFLAEQVREADSTAEWRSRWTVPPPPPAPEETDDLLHPLTVAWAVREAIAPDDIVVFDGGEFAQWVRVALRNAPNEMHTTAKIGGIGGGIPMALGIKQERPDARVIVLVGDGSAGYHLSEMETATRLGLPIVVVVGNDARWGAEWHMQRDRFGAGREVATELAEARYDIAAAGFGAAGYDLHYLGDLQAALTRALRTDLPVVMNVHIQAERSPILIAH
ncbi:MAG: thiamine pyrophosphate-binding protein [Thermomicrobiales bacterium]|nr:thiamine pyrophosphate-binding protein [Thermomicrobiales bacterium]